VGGIYDLQQVLGHESVKTTERYLDHLTPDETQAAKHGVAQKSAQDQRFAEKKVAKMADFCHISRWRKEHERLSKPLVSATHPRLREGKSPDWRRFS
jgi:hypothetical protein